MARYTLENQSVKNAPAPTGGDNMTKVKSLEESMAEINAKNNMAGSTIKAPSLSTYNPDYAGLESAQNDIQKSFDLWKQSAESQYGADRSKFDTNLEQTMRSLGTAKQETKQEYGKARQQIAEDVFMQNRQADSNMSSRGLSGSGVEALASIQNRMAQGEVISGLANEFNDAQVQLVETERVAKENYNNSLLSLNASLQQTMSQILNAKASNKMDYMANVESLKQQVINSVNSAKEAQYAWSLAQQEREKGSQITNTMVNYALKEAGSDQERLGALLDMGFTSDQANSYIKDYKTGASTKTLNDAQTTVNNLLASGVKASEIKALLTQQVVEGLDLDISKINFGDTKPKVELAEGMTYPKYNPVDVNGMNAKTGNTSFGSKY